MNHKQIEHTLDEDEDVVGEEDDEDSVNIDDAGGYEAGEKQRPVNNLPDRAAPGLAGCYSDFATFPYASAYRDIRQDSDAAAAVKAHELCDLEVNRRSSSEFGQFSSFRFSQQQANNISPRRSPESSSSVNYPKDYPTKSARPADSGTPEPSGFLDFSQGRQSQPSAMLEHKLPFNFLGPPLAALHSMTEMKTSLGGDSNNNNTSVPSMSSPNAGLTAQTMHGGANAPNPHGIDTILSRPPPVTTAGLNALTAGQSV